MALYPEPICPSLFANGVKDFDNCELTLLTFSSVDVSNLLNTAGISARFLIALVIPVGFFIFVKDFSAVAIVFKPSKFCAVVGIFVLTLFNSFRPFANLFMLLKPPFTALFNSISVFVRLDRFVLAFSAFDSISITIVSNVTPAFAAMFITSFFLYFRIVFSLLDTNFAFG